MIIKLYMTFLEKMDPNPDQNPIPLPDPDSWDEKLRMFPVLPATHLDLGDVHVWIMNSILADAVVVLDDWVEHLRKVPATFHLSLHCCYDAWCYNARHLVTVLRSHNSKMGTPIIQKQQQRIFMQCSVRSLVRIRTPNYKSGFFSALQWHSRYQK